MRRQVVQYVDSVSSVDSARMVRIELLPGGKRIQSFAFTSMVGLRWPRWRLAWQRIRCLLGRHDWRLWTDMDTWEQHVDCFACLARLRLGGWGGTSMMCYKDRVA